MNEPEKEIRKIQDTLLSYPAGEKLKLLYEIHYCNLDDPAFKIARYKNDDLKSFTKNCKEVIQNYYPDAVSVLVYENKKKIEQFFIKLTDTYIPLVDDVNKPRAARENTEEIKNPYRVELEKLKENTQALNGLIVEKTKELEIQGLREKMDTELRFLRQEYEHKTDKLNDKILNLEERLEEKIDQIIELEKDIIEYEKSVQFMQEELFKKQGDGDKVKTLGMVAGLGKLLGFEKNEIMELSGLVLGGEEEKTSHAIQEKKGGLVEENETEKENELSPEEQVRKTNETKIISWLQSVDETTFSKVALLLQTVSNDMNLLDAVLKQLATNETEKHGTGDTENEY